MHQEAAQFCVNEVVYGWINRSELRKLHDISLWGANAVRADAGETGAELQWYQIEHQQ